MNYKPLRFGLGSRLISILIIAMILIFGITFSCSAEDEVYEKGGCIYIVGNPTAEEQQLNQIYYKQRMAKQEAKVEAEIQRAYQLEIAQLEAQATKDLLMGMLMPFREIANAIRSKRITVINSNRASIGAITNSATAVGTGGSSTNANVNDSTFGNSADIN